MMKLRHHFNIGMDDALTAAYKSTFHQPPLAGPVRVIIHLGTSAQDSAPISQISYNVQE